MHFLLTGGTGFIGQRLARRIIERGDTLTVLVRSTSKRGPLEALGVRFAEGDLLTGQGLTEAVAGVDCVLHLAGVTKARTEEGYFQGNAEGTRRLARALAALPKPPRLVFCSSLAAAGPSVPGQPRREEETPAPVSRYGRSKLGGEAAVREFSDRVPSVIVRPPIVYGPGDQEFLPALLPMARLGLVLKSGFGPKHYSLIHVDDLCTALLAAAERGQTLRQDAPEAGVYMVSDGSEYRWEDFCVTLAEALGRAPPTVLPVPEAISYVVGLGSELAARVRGTIPMLSRDKVREMRCAAWTCSTERATKELGFTPVIPLAQGLQSALAAPK
ncbi:NAD-dependent epimerase/dehydratase family protein [Stigmatella aurantiaca]|uniref:Oxidoreductase, short chain dehydrogenase/reductase family n=1 Tax=Stigmatella aurantiaca (strain DW4/3-1) TaxID=378806 RepID=E3FQZ2_STIAD|nr:NAD-dependent epimerase/dehydratase family protein [Stigmatella aurantiaca]ADO72025.1 Oxidoreductase, short chain dehydrogenase/reductase family [Stigmatella aurantiaca DW4/3-1]